MLELFDVVDRQDRPTGRRVTKQQAHDDRLLHRCVAVYVWSPDGRLYVQVHKKSGLLDHAVGGHVAAGEEYETAAYREAEEELGLQGVQLELLCKGFYSPESTMLHMFAIYECTAPSTWRFVSNDEVDEVHLRSVADVVAHINSHPHEFTFGFINTMHYLLEAKHLPHAYKKDLAPPN